MLGIIVENVNNDDDVIDNIVFVVVDEFGVVDFV